MNNTYVLIAFLIFPPLPLEETPMNNTYVLIGILIMSIVTILLRFVPFIFLSDKKDYKILNYLSKVLPVAIMGMLVIYCLKDISFDNTKNFVPALIASGITAISYIVKRKTLLSILAGTIIYMVFLQIVF